MAKKTARAAKPNQQRSREEQWRRRVASQGLAIPAQSGTEVAVESDEETGVNVYSEVPTTASTTTVVRPRAAATQPRMQSGSTAGQRRAGVAARASKARVAQTSLSLDDEMYYVRSDIKRLIILTAICLAVLIILSFVIK